MFFENYYFYVILYKKGFDNMEKNYYEILEIDKKASSEIIKKAYSTLAKKYHPDLQPEDLKHVYEEKLKLINEAYETLSDNEKRKNYDIKLKNLENENNLKNKEIIDNLLNENNILKTKLNNLNYINKLNNSNNNNNSEMEKARQQAYHDAYIQDLKNRGYKIKYKKTPKEYFKNLISLIITILIFIFIWQLPFVRNLFAHNEGLNFIAKFLENIFSK